MAIPSSGPISLNQFHVEAGGGSGTQASINDSDIRGLISKSSGAQMAFNEWYGASNVVAPPAGVHRITFTLNLQTYVSPYTGVTYYSAPTTWSIIGGTQASRQLYQLGFGGTLRSDHTGLDNVTNINMRTNGSNVNNPAYTLFPEIDTYDSRMKITDNNNNQIFEARFGLYLSPTPSFPTNPYTPYPGIRRPTASYRFDLGECGESNEYMWYYINRTHGQSGNYHMFDIEFGQPYKIFFQP